VLVVSPYKGTFSPYGAKLRTQQPRQFFWVRARIFLVDFHALVGITIMFSQYGLKIAQEAWAPIGVHDFTSNISLPSNKIWAQQEHQPGTPVHLLFTLD
jgi:hypothetical protein